jgi:hypothetical protein
MRRCAFYSSFLLLVPVFLFAQDGKRKFGSEWIKIGDDYVKALPVVYRHSVGGNCGYFHLYFDNKNILYGNETDDNKTSTIGMMSPDGKTKYGEIVVGKHSDGHPDSVRVTVGHWQHIDFDNNGLFDASIDLEACKMYIIIDEERVRVEEQLTAFATPESQKPTAKDYVTHKTYEFSGGKWALAGY